MSDQATKLADLDAQVRTLRKSLKTAVDVSDKALERLHRAERTIDAMTEAVAHMRHTMPTLVESLNQLRDYYRGTIS